MIYITGDMHGDFTRLKNESFPMQENLTKDDTLIVLGDFGAIWDYRGETEEEKYWLDWIEDKPFTTVFLDGNHECFDRLYKYPEGQWKGGKVHVIRPSVLHLMRGEIFEIDGLTFFAFGGAKSHDESLRTKGNSWWALELPTEEEMQNGRDNLKRIGNKVDFVITHAMPRSIGLEYSGGIFRGDYMTAYFDELIDGGLTFTKWFAGHWHIDKEVKKDFYVLYDKIIGIERGV